MSQCCRGMQIGSFDGVRPISIEFPRQRAIATRLNKGQSNKSANVRASSVLSAATRHLRLSQLLSTFESHGFDSEMAIGASPARGIIGAIALRRLSSRAVRLGKYWRSRGSTNPLITRRGPAPHRTSPESASTASASTASDRIVDSPTLSRTVVHVRTGEVTNRIAAA